MRDSPLLVDESTAPKPVSLCAQTCRLSEELLLTYPSIGPIVLRLPSGFGVSPRMRFDLLLTARRARLAGGSDAAELARTVEKLSSRPARTLAEEALGEPEHGFR
jgi:hypothetical protein